MHPPFSADPALAWTGRVVSATLAAMIESAPAPAVSPRPRRILALDGGGIRGVFTLKILERIERHYRVTHGRPDLVLRDVFDFFAGTSTGAIIAACLAWGKSVQEVLDLYQTRGAEMFAPSNWLQRVWKSKYRADVIADFFRTIFVEDDGSPALLGTERLIGGADPKYLLAVMRNVTTGSAWPVNNNPRALFNNPADPGCNLNIPIWQLLRASTAAPTFFPPEEITLGDQVSIFVDGGLTPYNNPALIAVLMATLPSFRMEWPTGPDRLQVVSVGTGSVRARLSKTQAREVNTLDFARYIAPAMISGAAHEQDFLCRVLGECRYGAAIDMEIGDLMGPGLLSTAEKKFSYLRYDRAFTAKETADLEAQTGQDFSLDNLELMPVLMRLGEEYADAHVRPEHFI